MLVLEPPAVVDFDGRKGFLRLAHRKNVPLVPVVSIGGQETALFLTRGERLAQFLRLDRFFRLKVLPISLALPWGLNIGDMFGHLPPISFWGRVSTGRLVIPKYDVVFVARADGKQKMTARFISNVDPDDANGVLADLKLETTLFILVSKSGVTQETLANERLVRAKIASAGLVPNKHMIAVTSKTSPETFAQKSSQLSGNGKAEPHGTNRSTNSAL